MTSTSPRIIALTGHMGVGKDAAAALLSMVGYTRVAFADQVREEVALVITGAMEFPPRALAIPGLVADMAHATIAEVWAKPTSERMRRILQLWGSEVRRAENPEYWVNRAMGTVNSRDCFIFSDMRFPNEAAAIREAGGVIWKIERPVTLGGVPNHVSEAAIKDISADRVIENTGTLLDLAGKLNECLYPSALADATGQP